MEYVLIVIILGLMLFQYHQSKKNLNLAITNSDFNKQLRELQMEVVNLQDELGSEREKNRSLLSQKKSSETRLGQISEHLVPFLEGCPYDPKQMHFIGAPIDFIVFNFDDGSITFLEIKSGNSKISKRQKVIKNIVKSGRVYYDEIRVNEKGLKHKKHQNLEEPLEIKDKEDVGQN